MKTEEPGPILGMLKPGAILRPGDEYRDPYTGKWHPTTCAGKAVGIPNCTSHEYRRRIPAGVLSPNVKDEPRDK